MVCGTVVDIIAVATRMGSTGPSSEEELILLRKWPWWYDPMETPSINTSVIQKCTVSWTKIFSKEINFYITKMGIISVLLDDIHLYSSFKLQVILLLDSAILLI